MEVLRDVRVHTDGPEQIDALIAELGRTAPSN